jgi:hypothetical protein
MTKSEQDSRRVACDREIGRLGGLWHRCGRRAVVQSLREVGGWGYTYPYMLNYCEKHREAASCTDLPRTIRILSVKVGAGR